METAATAARDARPLIVPIFIPQLGCPHHCVFCCQRTVTGKTDRLPSPDQIHREVHRFLQYGKHRTVETQVAFFGGNFLGLEWAARLSLLKAAARLVENGTVDSIRFSTRPDTVDASNLDRLAAFPVSTVELGVQSMDDSVLALAGRGHWSADSVAAARLVKARGYRLGLQMMVGLPGDSAAGAMETAHRMADLKPDFVRIYPTLVLKGSLLADWLNRGRYHPMPLDACVDLVKRIYLYFKASGIPVIRMGLQASEGLNNPANRLAGPYHPAFGHLVHAAIVFDALRAAVEKLASPPDPLPVSVHPKMISRVQGLNKQNLFRLKQRFGVKTIRLVQDERLTADRLVVAGQPVDLP